MLEILVVDDDEMAREPIAEALSQAGHRVAQAGDGEAALAMLGAHEFDLAVCDIRMPRLDGLTLFRRMRREARGTDVVMMTLHAEIPDAVATLRDGAVDFVTKPFDPDDFARDVVGPIDERRTRRRALEHAHSTLASRYTGRELVGMSRVMRELSRRLAAVAPSECPVFIRGEAGTGRKLMARTLHARSARRDGPFAVVPCATLPDLMLELEMSALGKGWSELRRDAWFRVAEGGTLVLDAVDTLPISAQSTLLRVLQEPGVTARRATDWTPQGVRIVSLSTQNLAQLAEEGRFLRPLLYRLNTVELHAPRLAERDGDLYLLAVHFLRERTPAGAVAGRTGLSPAAWHALSRYAFPGNVGELAAALAAAHEQAQGGEIDVEHLPEAIRGA
jgi:DNA-binding NtrC family response regulator